MPLRKAGSPALLELAQELKRLIAGSENPRTNLVMPTREADDLGAEFSVNVARSPP
jgi:hypothetical protein